MTQLLSPFRIMLSIVILGLTAAVFAPHANADEWNHRTLLTVNQTIQVTDTVLEPGQYILRLLDSSSERHVVQIFNRDQSRIISTVIAIPTHRVEPTGRSQFTFWETPGGYAKAIRDWYYPGDNVGQEFPYPAHPHLMAAVESPALSPSPAAEMTPPAPAASAAPPPAVEPNPEPPAESAAPAPALEQAPPVADQTPTGSADQAPQPEPAQPAELPQTASPYPLLGISGLASLALAALLRYRRLA